MTSLAFIFGVSPLVWAVGAGAELRQTLGTAVFSGMIGVTAFGLIFTPVFYVVSRWLALRLARRARAAGDESARSQRLAMKFGFGQPLTRKEDDALLRGAGRYVADVAPDGALHAVVLRSPHAHARFRIARSRRACARMPGVRLVLTARRHRRSRPAADARRASRTCRYRGAGLSDPGARRGAPCRRRHRLRGRRYAGAGQGRRRGDRGRLAAAAACDRRRGRARARRAAGVAGPPGNLAFETAVGDAAATKAAFAQAARTVELTIVNQRLVTNYMDTRGVDRRIRRRRATRSRSAARAATSSATSSAARC